MEAGFRAVWSKFACTVLLPASTIVQRCLVRVAYVFLAFVFGRAVYRKIMYGSLKRALIRAGHLGPARIMPAFQQNERSEAKTGLDPDRPTGPARHVPVSQQNERPEAHTGLDPGRPLGPAGSCLPSNKTNVQRLKWAFVRAGHQGCPG